MNLFGKSIPARRTLFALAIAFTSLSAGAHAQSISQVDQALGYLYPPKIGFEQPAVVATSSNTVATAAEFQNAMELIAASTSTSVSAAGHSMHNGLGLPQDVAPDITLVSGTLGPQSVDTIQVDMLAGFYAGTSNNTGTLTQYLPSVAAAAAAYGNFTTTEADLAESTIVGDAITDSKQQLAAILDAALAVTDPNPSAQAALLIAKATSNNLNAASLGLGQLAADIGGTNDIGGGSLTSGSTGAFLEGVVKAVTSGTGQTGFLEGYVAGAVPSGLTAAQLATTATNIIAAAPSTFTTASRISVFTGLATSGTSEGLTLAAVLPGITTGILAGQTYGANAMANDIAITALVDGATGMINAYPGQANLIAQAAATALKDPIDDTFAFTNGVVGNSIVKTGTGANSIVAVTQAISDDFTLSNVTATTGYIQAKEGAVEAGIKALSSAQVLSGSAGQIVSQAAAQVLTTSTASGALVTFATNFITAIDTKNSNDPAISAADRAYAAIGLAQATDSDGIVGASTAIAAAAVATYDTSVLDINDVAQPILQHFSVVSGTETGAMAAAISQLGGTYTAGGTMYNYTPAYLAAQLILAAKTTASVGNPSTPLYNLIDEIALGTAASSAILTGSFGGSTTPNYGTADKYLSALAGNLSSVTALPFLKNIATYLSATTPYSDTEVVADFATGLTNVSAAVSAVSGTIAAVVSGSNPSDAAAIAHAAAANVGLDSVRYTIAQDVTKNVPGSIIAISGSVAETITGVAGSSTYTQGYDLAVLTHDLVALDTSVSDDSAIALNAANAVPVNDTSNLESDLANIVKNAVPTVNGTFNKTAANITIVADNIAIHYNGSLSGSSGTLGGYGNVALLAKDVLADFPAVSTVGGAPGLSDDLATDLVPKMIGANGDSPVSAASIADIFTTDLPNSSVAIATAATESSLYTSSPLTAEQSGTIGASIVASLPTTAAFATKIPSLSGSIAYISAEAAAPPATAQATINTAVQDVAGVFASYATVSGSVPASAYSSVAESLGTYALATGGTSNALKTLTIPSIFEAFASPTTLGSTATTAEVWLTKLIGSGAGDLHDIWNAADIFGVALQADYAKLGTTTIEGMLETSIATDIGATASAAGWQELISADNSAGKGAFYGDTSATTLTTLKAQLDSLLAKAAAAAATGLNYNPANPTAGGYGNITANETPVVNM